MENILTPASGLLNISIQSSVLILVVLAVQMVFGRRMQPRWRHALWLLVLLRLALPWSIPSPTSIFNLLHFPEAQHVSRTDKGETIQPTHEASSRVSKPVHPIATVISNKHHLSFPGMIWTTGALLLLGYSGSAHYRLHRQVKRLHPLFDQPTLYLLEECRTAMGVSVPITVIETEAVMSPSLFGFIRPRLLLPKGLISSFSREELRHIFLHELAHMKRHDILVGWAMLVLQAIHWFNPLVWLAFARARVDRELACDSLALSYARKGENESYGLTIVKLLEGYSQPGWAPGLARILENKQQMKERMSMIARYQKTNRGFALSVVLFAGIAAVTLTNAQDEAPPKASKSAPAKGSNGWNLDEKRQLAEAGNQWALYELWDAHYTGKHGVAADPAVADKYLKDLVKDVWIVRFEPTGDFNPRDAGEFLKPVSKYAKLFSGKTNIGHASFFRTTKNGDKLIGSFLSNYPDELKAGLAKVPNLKVTSAEKITPAEFVKYQKSQQESFAEANSKEWNLQAQIKKAEGGNKWASFELWQAYSRGEHGVQQDKAQADKWLADFVQDVWVVRFEPIGEFAPKTPGEFLSPISKYAKTFSGRSGIGHASFFRTTKRGDKLVGSFLSNYPDELKEALKKVPDLKVISSEKIAPDDFLKYQEAPQESL